MAFKFPLASILRLRQSQQRQQELALEKKNLEVNQLHLKLADTQAEIVRISSLPPHRRSAAEIKFDQELLRTCSLRCGEIQQRLHRAVGERDLAATEFHRAWQRCETLEILQRQSQAKLELDESRRAQCELDDWFLQRKRHG
jgi:flagellar biosynthesis chaperone FliJ